ncbi:MAG TPA: glycerol-3-phosphate dehydrogenase C-terminal domain-containing protein, partial [Solirubrobacteraceae bacterium]|nr:glycerol-3-phosphate dehydrogenase C-terminal domain-containing protein [Solirubrobacteraceae bacterium]
TNRFFGTGLGPADLVGAYAGVRPLISSGDSRKSVDISRKAELYETSSGLITITGGKLTTWRRMAKMAVDRMVERDGREAPCRTQEIPLGQPTDPAGLPRIGEAGPATYELLAHRYGHAAAQVLRVAAEEPALAEPILPDLPDLLAEAAFSVRHEQARTVGDVLFRRTRLGLVAGRQLSDPTCQAPVRVARAMARELGWGEDRVQEEVAQFRAEAAAEGAAGP